MSKNNLLKKSEKKFIRFQKARIRAQFLDFEKQEELINELYKKFLNKPEVKQAVPEAEISKEDSKKKTKIKDKNQKRKHEK